MARIPISLPVSGAKLRELRERAGLHQLEVQDQTEQDGHKVDRAWLSRIENDRALPSLKALKALLAVYGASIDDVLVKRRRGRCGTACPTHDNARPAGQREAGDDPRERDLS